MRLPAMTASQSLAVPARPRLASASPVPTAAARGVVPSSAWDKGPPSFKPEDIERKQRELAEQLFRAKVDEIAADIRARCPQGNPGDVSWPETVTTQIADAVAAKFPDEGGPFGSDDCAYSKPCQLKGDGRSAYNFWRVWDDAAGFNYHLYVPAC